ncbi:MAG: thrombospondin type 3 repeat-containing protein [Polyangiaceae bacterium]
MRSTPSLASILAILSLAAITGCDDGGTTTSAAAGSGGTGGDTTTGGGGTGGNTGGSMGGTGGSTGGTGGSTGGTGGSTGGTGGMMIDPVVDCANPDITPPADPKATCQVVSAGTSGVLFRGTLLLPDQVMHKGELLVAQNGTITCAECDCSGAPGAGDATVVECANGVVSPGLINPHDHITFAQNAPKPHLDSMGNPSRYDHRHEWRQGAGANKPKITAPGGASTAAVLLAELRFVMSGATTAASAGGRAGLLRNLDSGGLGEGVSLGVNSDTFPLDDTNGTVDTNIGNGCNYGAGPTTAAQIASDDAYLPHISEGVNVAAHNEFLCTSSAPPPANANDIIEPKTSIIHAVGLDALDIAKIRTDTAKVIWSPRSNVDLYGNTAQITVLDALGVPIALGTDWLPSGSMNMLRELRCADELNTQFYGGHFGDKQLWQMVTTNGALALGVHDILGMLKPGYVADIAVFNGAAHKDYRAVIDAGSADVVLVVRGGEVLYGDGAVVQSLRPGCETIDVCTFGKRACVTADVGGGTTLASLTTEAQAVYPMFFCPTGNDPEGIPQNEPSCVPYRPTEYNGVVPGTDDDGDGVPNDSDNCPTVFNPKRPMDSAQPDGDGDKKGDACDPCPLDANDACAVTDANDLDGDGWFNGYDNCPYSANADQADKDNDGHGDACDKCPDQANPGLEGCTFSIKSIRDPSDPLHPNEGDSVTIKDVYVTGIRPNTGNSRGFYVQDTTLAPFSGIFIFTGGSLPNVQVGNRVTITGNYVEFFELSELSNPTVTVTDNGTTLPFAPIAVADPATIATGGAMAEGYESMLLKIGAVTVVNVNPDAPSDFDEFSVTGNLRIDDLIFDNTANMGLNNTCAVGKGFASITGIHAFSFGNFKLEPRFATDIELLPMADANFCQPF